MIEIGVANLSNKDRQARVTLFFSGRPDLQYGRDLWVPANSSISSWILVGPPHLKDPSPSCAVEALLYELIDGKERLILLNDQESVRSYLTLYRKRSTYASIMLDERIEGDHPFGRLPQPPTGPEEALDLAVSFQEASLAAEPIHRLPPGPLPVSPETFDGLDQFVLASNRLAQDSLGTQALRQWLERGGKMWVMLDKVDRETLVPLLGEALDFEIIGRTSLTSTKIEYATAGNLENAANLHHHDRPIDFVRVMLPEPERPLQVIGGWPAAFTRQVGKGRVLFTTIGPRAWTRPRTVGDPAAQYTAFPLLPVAREHLTALVRTLSVDREKQPLVEEFRPLLMDEIGYTVVSRQTMVGVFVAFFLLAGFLIFLFRKTKHFEILGWLGPLAAVCAAGAFFVLGESSRRSAPATTATAQLIQTQAGESDASVDGLLAVFRPESGVIPLAARQGGLLEVDLAGIESPKRFMTTDLDSWRWDDLSLPAGVRFAPLRASVSGTQPLSVKARFGPEGLEGKIEAEALADLEDAVISTKNGRNLSVRLRPDGAFLAGPQDILPPDQFVSGKVLSDRQRLRQEFYRKFTEVRSTRLADDENALLVWSKPLDLHFEAGPSIRSTGTALVLMPLTFARPVIGQSVIIPAAFVPFRQLVNDLSIRPRPELSAKADMHLRFQLPSSVLPFTVERAKFTARIAAPSRRVTVSGMRDLTLVELHRVANPIDPIEIDIKDETLLKLDERGGLHLNLSFSDLLEKAGGESPAQGADKWTIEYVELEVHGRAAPANGP